MKKPEEFLRERRAQYAKMWKRVRFACIVVCVLWIPVALLVYRPSFLFETAVPDNTVLET